MQHHSINVGGRLLTLPPVRVMGILNATPDSFFAASRQHTEAAIAARANEIAEAGAIIDVGACSTRPGSTPASEAEEMARLRVALAVVRREQPEAVLSVDTFRPDVARMAVEEYGADIINDVSEGFTDGPPDSGHTRADDSGVPPMFSMVARLRVPYVLTSVRPTVGQMLQAFAREVRQLYALGQSDIILDPGFGFGKTLEQNFAVLHDLEQLHVLGLPVMVGLSRKSMVWKTLGTTADKALNGTTALHAVALMKGAAILRVHDVREAAETVRLVAACGA